MLHENEQVRLVIPFHEINVKKLIFDEYVLNFFVTSLFQCKNFDIFQI